MPHGLLPIGFKRVFGPQSVDSESIMNLHGSIKDLQNKKAQLYLKLEHRFSENGLIRELWSGMANDVWLQIRSLSALPPSFWNHSRSETCR